MIITHIQIWQPNDATACDSTHLLQTFLQFHLYNKFDQQGNTLDQQGNELPALQARQFIFLCYMIHFLQTSDRNKAGRGTLYIHLTLSVSVKNRYY